MTTDLLDRLEALVEFARNGFNRVPGMVSLAAIESLISNERKRRESVRPTLHHGTPEECLLCNPDPREALLSQAREALEDASLEHSTWTTGHAERCSLCKAIAAIDAFQGRKS